ncbi:MAG: NifB/NifX family molybdenum-iron cluster-binding protein [Acidobacteria bacterium]|jgi:hypothetical protein|nr:NifB/NifX family molybdenum-iron cluster-binding protein [Acidobacteriota bacterium]
MSNSIENMKVVVTVFRGVISPRVDIADSLWIYDVDKEKKIASLREKCSAEACEHPLQLIAFLREKGIHTLVCGGCPQFFLRMLAFHDIKVTPGIMGDPVQFLRLMACEKMTDPSPTSMPGPRIRHRRRRCCENDKINDTKNKRR